MNHSNYCKDPLCPICKKLRRAGSYFPDYNPKHYTTQFDFKGSGYTPKQYTGKFSVQGLDKPLTSQHYSYITMDDLEDAAVRRVDRKQHQEWLDHNKSKKEVKMPEDETQDVEIQTLYEVITTYGGDRENVIVERTEVVAESETRALMQAKDDINSSWDIDYVDQHVVRICDVRVKRKLREILQG